MDAATLAKQYADWPIPPSQANVEDAIAAIVHHDVNATLRNTWRILESVRDTAGLKQLPAPDWNSDAGTLSRDWFKGQVKQCQLDPSKWEAAIQEAANEKLAGVIDTAGALFQGANPKAKPAASAALAAVRVATIGIL